MLKFSFVLYIFQAMLVEESVKFPIFANLQTLSLEQCLLDKCDLNNKLDALGSFVQNAPCLEKLTLQCCMVINLLCFLVYLMVCLASDMNLVVLSKVSSRIGERGAAHEEKHNSSATGPKYFPVPEVEVHTSRVRGGP